MKCIIVIFLKDNKLLSHMDHMNEQINSKNQKVHFYDQTRKMIFHLVSKKGKNKDNSSTQITCLENFLLVIIVNKPEN